MVPFNGVGEEGRDGERGSCVERRDALRFFSFLVSLMVDILRGGMYEDGWKEIGKVHIYVTGGGIRKVHIYSPGGEIATSTVHRDIPSLHEERRLHSTRGGG